MIEPIRVPMLRDVLLVKAILRRAFNVAVAGTWRCKWLQIISRLILDYGIVDRNWRVDNQGAAVAIA